MLQFLCFRTDLAVKYGVNEAILLQQIVYFTQKNHAEAKHFYEGRYWMYASVKGLSGLYSFWSASQIKRIIARLRDCGALLAGNFNEDRMVRTSWYSPSDEILALYDTEFPDSPIGQIRKMQGTNSSSDGTNSENVYKDKKEKKENTPVVPKGTEPFFDRFWKAYPKKKGKAAAQRAWKKLAPDMDLCRVMANALDRQKQSEDWRKAGGQYIPYPASWLNGRRWEDEEDTEAFNEEGEDGI